jgi:hypothetical protein
MKICIAMASLLFATTALAQETTTSTTSTTTLTPTVTGSANQVTISWPIVRGATGYTVMRREVERSSTTSQTPTIVPLSDWAQVAAVASGPATDVLSRPSTYEYRVDVATLRMRMTGTPVLYTAPPFTTPTNVRVSATSTSATVTWSLAIGVVGYHVWRRPLQPGATAIRRTTSMTTAPTFTDQIESGTAYEYQVQGVHQDLIGYPSAWVSFKPVVELLAPVVTASGLGNATTLRWTGSSGASGYEVTRAQLDASGKPLTGLKPIGPRVQTTLELVDQLDLPGAYQYVVSAVSMEGARMPSKALTYVSPDFMTPQGLVAAGAGGHVGLNRCAASRVQEYRLYRRDVSPTGGTSAPKLVGRGQNTSYQDMVPVAGTYEYMVAGVSSTDGTEKQGPWVRYVALPWQ